MIVSAEIIAIVAMGATLLIAQLGGIGWLITRMDTKFDAIERKVDARFDKVDARFEKVDARLSVVERELTEVKISIARFEGPPRRLISAR